MTAGSFAGLGYRGVNEGRKRFFLKKEAKTLTRLSRTRRRKSFLVLFFKKELLS